MAVTHEPPCRSAVKMARQLSKYISNERVNILSAERRPSFLTADMTGQHRPALGHWCPDSRQRTSNL